MKAIAIDSRGNVYSILNDGSKISIVSSSDGSVSYFSSYGNCYPNAISGTIADFLNWACPFQAIAVDTSDKIYLGECTYYGSCLVRRVDLTAGVFTVLYSPVMSSASASMSTSASLQSISAMAVDSAGNVIIADPSQYKIWTLSAVTKTISVLAGNVI
jgi:hypothetical protein